MRQGGGPDESGGVNAVRPYEDLPVRAPRAARDGASRQFTKKILWRGQLCQYLATGAIGMQLFRQIGRGGVPENCPGQ
jgi:hypothetical protein